MTEQDKQKGVKEYNTFLDAVKSLNQGPVAVEYDNDLYDSWAKSEFDETLANLNNKIDLTNGFVNFFNANDILLRFYYFEQNDNFWKLAKAYAVAKNFMNGEPQTYFTQTNADDNNSLNNFYYELIEEIKRFSEFSKNKITQIELLSMPESLAELFEDNEKY